MTLPTNAPIGGEISVEKVDVSANVVTISGTIRGTSSTIDLSSQYDARTFLSEGNGSWRPISDHRTQTSLDARYGKKTDGGVFNVKAYGAKGDGVTDDTTAIQNAANDACAAKGTLLVPPSTGAYMVNPAVTNASGTSVNIINLTGPCDVVISRGATVKVISSTTPFVCVFGGQTTVLDMSGLSYSGGGTIDGNSTARRAAHVVPNTTTPCVGIGRINKGSGIKVLNLRFTNFDSIWCVTMSSSGPGNMSDVEIAGCRFDNLGTLTPADKHDFSGIYIDAIGMSVHDNHFWQGVQGATSFSTNYGVRTAIELHGSGQHCYDNTTHGIQWGGNLWMSFNCWTETDSTGSKNLVGANWHDNVFDHVAVGVNLGGATQTGVNYGLTAVSVHHNEITVDPTLWNADTGGGTYASGVLVATSTLTGSWRGISIDHNDISITPNNTSMNTFTWSASPSATPSHICVILLGVNVSILRDWSISNNTLRGSGWDGIHVNAYSFENVTIANNRIIDPRLIPGSTGFGVYLVTNGTVGGTNNMNNCRISNNQVTDDQNSTDSPYGYTASTASGVIFATAGSASGTQFLDNGYHCKNGSTLPVVQGFTGSPAPLVRAVDHAATFSAPSGNWAAGSTITMMTQRNAAVPTSAEWRQTATAANGSGSTWRQFPVSGSDAPLALSAWVGCDSTGTTDSTAGIISALATGRPIIVKPGESYKIQQPTNTSVYAVGIPANARISGGGEFFIVCSDTTAAGTLGTAGIYEAFRILGSNVSIEGVTFRGSWNGTGTVPTPGPSSAAIGLAPSSGITGTRVHRNRFTGLYGFSVHDQAGNGRTFVTENLVEDCMNTFNVNSDYAEISHNIVRNSRGVEAGGIASDVSHNVILSTLAGTAALSLGGRTGVGDVCPGMKCLGNIIYSSEGTGITVNDGAIGARVEGNTIRQTKSTALIVAGSVNNPTGVDIVNNTFIDVGLATGTVTDRTIILLAATATGARVLDNRHIVTSTATFSAQYGVTTYCACTVGGNKISASSKDISAQSGSSIRMYDNDVTSVEILAGATNTTPGRTLQGSTTWAPGSLAAGAKASTTLTVTGAKLGDVVAASFFFGTFASSDYTLFATVTAADTVSVTIINNSGSSGTLGSGTLKVDVMQH